MKNLKLVLVFVLLFFLNNNQLFAQKKWIPYAGYVAGKSQTILKFEGKGALIGISIENTIKKKRLFFDYGLELTFLEESKDLGSGIICDNCDPVIAPEGNKNLHLELSAPALLKYKLLEKKRSMLMVKLGYAPTVSLPTTNYYYRFVDFSANIVERVYYENPTKYIHAFYFGLDYRFKIKENFALELSPICKYQIDEGEGFIQKRFLYGLAARTVFNF